MKNPKEVITRYMLDPVYFIQKTTMKVKELYEGYLSYRAKEGNYLKTLNEHRRFLEGPILEAVGERELSQTSLLWRADLIEAGKRYGLYGSQRAVVYFRQ